MRTTFLFALLLVFVLHVLVGAGRLRGYEMLLKEGGGRRETLCKSGGIKSKKDGALGDRE